MKGTYDELFTVLSDPAYDQLWIDNCAAIMGDKAAPETAMMLKNSCAEAKAAFVLYGLWGLICTDRFTSGPADMEDILKRLFY